MRILELRQYVLRPGRRDELIDLFEREFIEPHEALGMELPGLFRDAQRSDRFVWLRAFRDMPSRSVALERFYGGPIWRAHREAANATMIDSDNVLLLRSVVPDNAFDFDSITVPAPILCSIRRFETSAQLGAYARRFETLLRPELERLGASILGAFATEPSQNTYPRLPIREGEWNFVCFSAGLTHRDTNAIVAPTELLELLPTGRSRLQLAS